MSSLVVGAPSVASVVDGTSNTIAVVPVSPERAIPWTKPEDIPIDERFPAVGRPGGIAAPFVIDDKTRAAPILFADGSVRVVLDTIRPDVLQWFATRDGGEVLSFDLVPSLKIPQTGGAGGPASDQKVLKIDVSGPKPRAWIE
jgi:prepilin-type processing-associated H-X9-DG protein